MPLDIDLMIQIEVSIIYTEKLVRTDMFPTRWYEYGNLPPLQQARVLSICTIFFIKKRIGRYSISEIRRIGAYLGLN